MPLTYKFYPTLLAINLLALLMTVPRAIKLKREDALPLILILLMSLLVLFLPLPRHVVTGEFVFMAVAENIAKGEGYSYCMAYEGEKCMGATLSARPPGASVLMTPFIMMSFDTLYVARALSLVFGVLSGLVFYLCAKEFSDRGKGFASALLFTLLVSKVRLSLTTVSELPSLFFFVLVIYFMTIYTKRREGLLALCSTLSYFIHIRPENIFIALPLLVVFGWVLYKSPRDRVSTTAFLFLLVNYAYATTHMLSNFQNFFVETFAPITRFQIFSSNLVSNIQFFFDAEFFNPILTFIFIYGVFKLLTSRKDKLSIGIIVSFIVAFLLFTAFEFGDFRTFGHGIRYTVIPLTLFMLVLSKFIPKGRLFQGSVILLSLCLLLTSEVTTFSTISGEVFKAIEEDSFGLSGVKNVLVTPASIVHMYYPEKNVYPYHSMEYNYFGEGLYVYSPLNRKEVDPGTPPGQCNSSLFKQIPVFDLTMGVYNISC